MNAATKAIAAHGLARRALSLGAVKAFDSALQFLLPIVLVRCLDTATFGEYRLVWLAVGTVMSLATLGMPGALYFFLPRSDAPTRRLYVHQTLAFLAVAGLAAALVVSPLDPWMPRTLAPLLKYGALVPAFVGLWVVSFLLDLLPTVEERIPLQASATLSVAAARTVLLAAGAWLTGDLTVILWLLVVVVVLKLGFLLAYVQRFHGWGRPWFRPQLFIGHLRYAVPFGVSSGLYVLRAQADQWIAATLFTLHSFAAFSIAAILGQLVQLVRQSVMETFMPSMCRMEASGDVSSMMAMNASGNLMVGTVLLPLLGFVFAFAGDIVTVIYTASYVDAAPVMRVYIVGLAVLVVELSTVLQLMRQGMFSLVMNVVALAISVPLSWYCGTHFGLAGAAAGSVTALYIDRVVTLKRISMISGMPVRDLQHWRRLALVLAWTILSAALAWLVVQNAFDSLPRLTQLAVGFATLGAVYGVLLRWGPQ